MCNLFKVAIFNFSAKDFLFRKNLPNSALTNVCTMQHQQPSLDLERKVVGGAYGRSNLNLCRLEIPLLMQRTSRDKTLGSKIPIA